MRARAHSTVNNLLYYYLSRMGNFKLLEGKFLENKNLAGQSIKSAKILVIQNIRFN